MATELKPVYREATVEQEREALEAIMSNRLRDATSILRGLAQTQVSSIDGVLMTQNPR